MQRNLRTPLLGLVLLGIMGLGLASWLGAQHPPHKGPNPIRTRLQPVDESAWLLELQLPADSAAPESVAARLKALEQKAQALEQQASELRSAIAKVRASFSGKKQSPQQSDRIPPREWSRPNRAVGEFRLTLQEQEPVAKRTLIVEVITLQHVSSKDMAELLKERWPEVAFVGSNQASDVLYVQGPKEQVDAARKAIHSLEVKIAKYQESQSKPK